MIHYSPIPLEQLYNGIEDKVKAPVELELNGKIVQVEPVSEHEFKMVRLISPDPQDYLNPEYMPGATIKLKPYITD